MPNTAPPYTIGGITRPELFFDANGNIVLTPAAEQFAATYGLKLLYIGLPANTPYPPVSDSLAAPTDSNAAANSVAEGAAVNTPVNLTVSATSAGGMPVTYSLTADSSGGGFKIDPTTGVVTVADPTKIDFETSPGHAYSVTAQANDGIITTSQTFTINVTDVAPSAPVDANAAANSVAEGAAVNTLVGITASSTDVNGPGVTYSLVGDTSGGGFKIDPVTGVVSVADPTKIDYESSPGHAYTITAQASDGTLSSTQTFTIAVTDVPLPAPTDVDPATNTVAEGATAGTHVGITASAIDPNGPVTHYSLTGDTSGGGFAIDPNTGVVTVADPTKVDYESAAGHAYSITVKADDGLATTTQSFSIAVSDVAPSTPVDSNAAANTVVEGAANGSTVGVTASSTDVNGPAVAYSLTGDTSGGGFTINAATGVVTVADSTKIDYESAAGHAYTVTAQASDGTLTSSQTFTIAVNDVAPSTPVDSNAAGNGVAEGAANGTAVGITASSTDINGPAVTYSLIGDTTNGGYTINSVTGVVTVADGTKIDYESAPGHNDIINVQASDGTLTSSQTFTIAVTDVAPSQPVDSNAAANTVAEGAAFGTTVGVTASSTDPNGPAVTYILSLDSSGGGFAVNSSTGVVTVADPTKIDYESSGPSHAYTVTVVASDGTLMNGQTFTIGVTDVAPSTPVDTNGAANTVAEGAALGSTVGITASSTDVNGPAVTYSLTGDTSGGGFGIDPLTGVVLVLDPTKIDYETAPGHAYTVTAQASDGTLTSSQTFTIAVTDVAPSIPVDSNAAADTVAEGAAAGTTVGVTASSTDVNGPPVTYSLTGDTSGGGFTIDSATGVVTVADPTKVDYESSAGHAYTVTAQASDGTDVSSQTFTIAVTDVAPSTPVDADANANTIVEGAANGSTVGVTASSTDVNGPAVTYSLTGDTSGGGFTINATTGVVTVADSTKIDYESSGAGHSYTVTAQASDGTLTSSQTFTIAVTDVAPSTPVDSDAAADQVAVSSPAGTYVGVTASSTDVNGPAVVYSLVGDTSGGGFTIDPATGKVTVADPSKILAADPSYDVTVDSSDGTLHSQQTFTIAVVLDSPPVVTAGHTLSYTENQAPTAIDPALTVTDSDNVDLAHATVQITGNYISGQDLLAFTNTPNITGTFDASTGKLTLTGNDTVADYQAALDSVTYFNNSDNPSGLARTVTIIANDGTLDSTPATDTINVTPVDDAPVVTAGHTLSYTENQAATAIDSAITVTDVDNTTLASATVQITGNYANGQDILGFTNTANITGTFDAASGKLTLSGSDTVADYQAALDSVTYFNNSDNPSGLARTVTIIANDGTLNSTAATDTINVTPVDDAPVVTAGHTLNYLENQAPTAIDSAITVSDVDNTTLVSATVQITGNFAGSEDVLGFTNQNGITGTYNSATGMLTLTGSSSVAHYQTALDSVTYSDSSDNPSSLARTVTIIANDGTLNSTAVTDTINVTPVNDPPVITFGTINGFTEPPNGTPAANSVPITIAPNLTITDVDSTELNSATFVLNNLEPSDSLSISGHAGTSGTIGAISFSITSTANTETISFTGHDTIADYNSALDLVQFNNTSENPNQTARSYTVTAVDDGGTANGGQDTGSATTTQTVTAVDDAPTATVPADSSVGTAFSHTNLAISGLSVADVDAGSGNETATISATHGALTFTTTGLASFTNNDSHTVTLTGTIAQVNTALATLVYNSDDGFTGTDTVTLNINDNGNTGTGGPLSSGNQTFHVGVVPQVFYINNNASGSTNAGTETNPYTSIAAFNAANPAGTGDYVVLEHGTGTYSEANGINLAAGVNLIGGDENLSFTNPVTSAVVVANTASGTAPIIKVTSGSDAGIDLGTGGHTIEGVSVDTTAGSGIGVSDDGNNVGTVNMSDIVVKTASGAGLNFTHGGTLTVTGSSNSITSTTGTALDIANTTIGSSNVTFHDISSNGAVNGIVLNNTGSSGHLAVTGGGNASVGGDNSGGTIQNTTGDGISLTSTSGVSLTNIHVTNTSGNGILGTTVNGFTLANSTVDGANGGSAVDQGSVYFTNLTGTSAITNSVIKGGHQDNVSVLTSTGTLGLTISGSTIRDTDTGTNGNDNIFIEANGTGDVTAHVQNNTIAATNGDQLQTVGDDTATMTIVFTGNTVSGGGGVNALGEGITISGGHSSPSASTEHVNFNISNNTITGTIQGGAININEGAGSGTWQGQVSDNTVGNPAITDSGATQSSAIRVENHSDGGTLTALVDGNQLSQYNGVGINLQAGDTATSHGVLNATVTNNVETNPGAGASQGLALNVGVQSGSANVAFVNIHGNSLASTSGFNDIHLRERFTGTIHIDGYTGASNDTTAVANYEIAQNPGNTADASLSTGSGYFNGTTPLPTVPLLLAAAGGVLASSPTPGETNLTQAELDSVVAAAIAEWAAAGASASQIAALHAVTFSVADLSGNYLSGNIIGQEDSPTHITIDNDAAGHGWYIDPTPSDNSEFTNAQNASGTDLYTDPSNAAAGHMDLLTTVTHELGHVLGLPDTTATADVNDLMYLNLVDGERKLPDAADVAQANAIAAQTYAGQAQASEAALPVSAQAPSGTPIVVGTAGNDTIDAGSGGNVLFGGAGADNFVFGPGIQLNAPTVAAAQPITHVADYSAAQGDTFDFSALTSAFHASNVADASLVRAVEDPSGTFATLQLNTNAAAPAAVSRGATQPSAPANWVDVAQIDGAHAGDPVNVLVDSHAAIHMAQIHATLLV